MARKLTTLAGLFALCLLTFPDPAQAQRAENQTQRRETTPAHEYRARSMAALDAGKPKLAGQILMLSYQEHGDTEALYIAGMVFAQAGEKAMAWQVWSVYLCYGTDGMRRREVRLALHEMMPGEPPMHCTGPRSSREPKQSVDANPQARASQYAQAVPYRVAAQSHYAPRPVRTTSTRFELEAGLTAGDDAFGLTWGPGMWFGDTSHTHFGLFVPIMLGEKFDNNATLGLEPRLRMPLNGNVSLEVAGGLHTGEYPRYSLGAGINLNNAFTVGVSHEALLNQDGFNDSSDASGTFLNATLTGKAGKTATGIQAALMLLILGLAAGS